MPHRSDSSPPDNEALAAFLASRWGAPISTTRMIATGAAGNVRAAMADLEIWFGQLGECKFFCVNSFGVIGG